MDRIEVVRNYADSIIQELPTIEAQKKACIHTYGVAECCALIAGKRKLNAELASIIGLLHDIYAFKSGSHMYHSQSGADMARVAVRKMTVFSDEEKTIILSAIFHHANKDLVHDEYDEVLKDADILQPFLKDANFCAAHYRAAPRLHSILHEFEISTTLTEYGAEERTTLPPTFNRTQLANYAERLAAQQIHGERTDSDYMELIKYFPEDSAFDELKNRWCAAFVYHCLISVGLSMPIRYHPMANTRFACVEAWLEWSKKNGFCFYEKNSFIPVKGDIVINNNVIPAENKPAEAPWYDHIGIVLSVDDHFFVAAEGNIDNNNISGIITRDRDNFTGCYIRIPDDYQYDGWKYDYKTGKIRIVKYK